MFTFGEDNMPPEHCPHCGAKIAVADAQVCDQCHQPLVAPPPPPNIQVTQNIATVTEGGTVKAVEIVYKVDDQPAREAQRQIEGRARQTLLDRLSAAYIDGKLHQQEQTLDHFAPGKGLLPLGKVIVPDALDPSATTLDELAYLERPELLRIAPDKPMADIFDKLGHSLLILGEPGSGKTVTLLELARSALDLARSQSDAPLPVVLELDTWQAKRPPLADWIVSEIRSSKYGISDALSRKWIEKGELLLLLDGLDQVIPEHRQDCVRAINEFLDQHGGNWIAITCRRQEYNCLPVRLKLQGAIQLEPLTPEQTRDFFQAAGSQLEGLHKAVQEDPALQEMVTTPLMLAVTSLAYEDIAQPELTGGRPLAAGARRTQLFADYVGRMFRYKVGSTRTYPEEQTKHWLSWLACQMESNHMSTFWIEQLEPSWLPSASWQWAYMFISRLVVGLIGGVIGGTLIGLAGGVLSDLSRGLIRGLIEGLIGGFITGCVVGGVDALWITHVGRVRQVSRLNPYVQSSIKLLVIAVTVGVSVALILRGFFETFDFLHYRAPLWLNEGISVGLDFGLSAGLFFALGPQGVRRGLTDDIHTVEQLNWSERAALRWGLLGVGVGALAGALASIFSRHTGLVTAFVDRGMTTGQIVLATMGIGIFFLGLAGAVFGGLSGTLIRTDKVTPNQGLRLSIHNAFVTGPLIGLMFMILGGVVGELAGGGRYAIIFGLYGAFFGLLAGMWWGGIFTVQHLTLRVLLDLNRCTPHLGQLAAFLDYCARLTFLRKVGGGYQFFHGTIQHYFTSLAGP
jgi:eukaryotic-like serine/threonine-protein kinase